MKNQGTKIKAKTKQCEVYMHYISFDLLGPKANHLFFIGWNKCEWLSQEDDTLFLDFV